MLRPVEVSHGVDICKAATLGDSDVGYSCRANKPLDFGHANLANAFGDRADLLLVKAEVEQSARDAEHLGDVIGSDAAQGIVLDDLERPLNERSGW